MQKITLADIDPATTEAGSLLDVLMHETFFGGEIKYLSDHVESGWFLIPEIELVPVYSTAINPAMRVLEKFQIGFLDWDRDQNEWRAGVHNHFERDVSEDTTDEEAQAAPLAICRAALSYAKKFGTEGLVKK